MDTSATITLIRELTEGLFTVKLTELAPGIAAFRRFYEEGLPPFIPDAYKNRFSEKIQDLPKPFHIIHYRDILGVHYMVLNAGGSQNLVFGPYSPQEISEDAEEQILERSGFATRFLAPFHLYMQSLPVCKSTSLIFIAKTLFGHVTGRETEPFYSDCSLDAPAYLKDKKSEGMSEESDNSILQMLETRYALSRKFYNEVYLGNGPGAEQLYRKLHELHKPLRRTTNPLRNKKNLTYVHNTGLRLTVEKTGIHPFYLDSISSYYAIEIEKSVTIARLEQLEMEMISRYCQLVLEHSLKQYPPFSRNVIQYIHFHLSDRMPLEELAAFAGVSPSHLSRRFNQEVGESIPNYINRLRCRKAAQLLEQSQDEVHDIAYYVGYMDMNYFYKQFKKYYGMLPGEYQNRRPE